MDTKKDEHEQAAGPQTRGDTTKRDGAAPKPDPSRSTTGGESDLTIEAGKPRPRRRQIEGVEILERGEPGSQVAPRTTAPDTAVFVHRTCGTTFAVKGPGKADAIASECPVCGRVGGKTIVRVGTKFADGHTARRGDRDIGLEIDMATGDKRVELIRERAELEQKRLQQQRDFAKRTQRDQRAPAGESRDRSTATR